MLMCTGGRGGGGACGRVGSKGEWRTGGVEIFSVIQKEKLAGEKKNDNLGRNASSTIFYVSVRQHRRNTQSPVNFSLVSKYNTKVRCLLSYAPMLPCLYISN